MKAYGAGEGEGRRRTEEEAVAATQERRRRRWRGRGGSGRPGEAILHRRGSCTVLEGGRWAPGEQRRQGQAPISGLVRWSSALSHSGRRAAQPRTSWPSAHLRRHDPLLTSGSLIAAEIWRDGGQRRWGPLIDRELLRPAGPAGRSSTMTYPRPLGNNPTIR
jgi:hypothetical protein